MRTIEALPTESRTTAILASKVYLHLFAVLHVQGRDAEAEVYRRRFAQMARSPRAVADWEERARQITEGIRRVKDVAHS